MEFIRHTGELHCSGCSKVESNRNIYYAIADGKQIYWLFAALTRLTFGCEEIGPLALAARSRNPKIRRFYETGEVNRYGTNWN